MHNSLRTTVTRPLGWELSIPPGFEALQKMVADIKAGRDIRDLVERR